MWVVFVSVGVIVEADGDVEIEAEVSVESQLSTYLQLQMQLFSSVVAETTKRRHDETDVQDLIDRFSTLQHRQMKIITAIQASRFAAEQVHYRTLILCSQCAYLQFDTMNHCYCHCSTVVQKAWGHGPIWKYGALAGR